MNSPTRSDLPKPAAAKRTFAELGLWAACGALGVAYVWLTSALRVQALFGAIFDDALFMRSAMNLLQGRWLGAYDNLTLVKGPGYALFLATASVLGVPVVTAQAALYALACAVVIAAVRPIVRSRAALALVFAVLLFNPELWSIWRIIRDYFYTAVSLATLSFAIGVWVRRDRRLTHLMPWLIGAGLSMGLLAITREETVWMLPPLAVLAAALAASMLRPPARRRLARLALCAGAPAAIAVAIVGANAAMNRLYYGTWDTVEMVSRDFGAAYGALSRVRPRVELHWVPLPAEARARIYALSPAFAELKQFFEAQSRPWACDGVRPECEGVAAGEIPGAWFQWALRDAASVRGYYTSPARASAYFRRLAGEVNAACDSGALDCLPPREGLAPPLPADAAQRIAGSAGKAAAFLLELKIGQPSSQQSVFSSGDSPRAASLKVFGDAILPFEPGELTSTRIDGWMYSHSGPIDIAVRDRTGRFWNSTVTWQASPDVAELALQAGHLSAAAGRARFSIDTNCPAACQLFVLVPAGTLAIFDVPPPGMALSNQAVSGFVADVATSLPPANTRWSGSNTPVNAARLAMLDALTRFYRSAVIPLLFAAGAAAFVGAAAAQLLQRRPSDVWLVAAVFGAALASRLGLLIVIEAISYPAINILYMAPAFPAFFAWCSFSLIAAWQQFRPAAKATVPLTAS